MELGMCVRERVRGIHFWRMKLVLICNAGGETSAFEEVALMTCSGPFCADGPMMWLYS